VECKVSNSLDRKGTDSISGIYHILGVQSYLLSPPSEQPRTDSTADMRLATLSNFSNSHAIVSISLALRIMGKVYLKTASEEKVRCSLTRLLA
jgi:hypothetical protein